MEFTAIHNRQKHPLYLMLVMYQDRQYFVTVLMPNTSVSFATHLLAQGQIFLAQDEEEVEDLEDRIGPEFMRVKPRTF